MPDERATPTLGSASAVPLVVAAMSLVCLSQAGLDAQRDPLALALVCGALAVANLATWRLYRRAQALERRDAD